MVRKINALLYSFLIIFGLLILQLGMVTVFVMLSTGLKIAHINNIPDLSFFNAIAYICYSIVGGGILIFMYVRAIKKDKADSNYGSGWVYNKRIYTAIDGVTAKNRIKNIIILVVIAVSVVSFLEAVLSLVWYISPNVKVLNDIITKYTEFMKELDGTNNSIIFIYTLLLGPIVEELTFRGLIFRQLSKAFSMKTTVIIQAFLFGLMHFQLIQSSYAFLLGIIMGIILYKRKSIIELIIMHIMFNIIGVSLMASAINALSAFIGVALADIVVAVAGLILLIVFLILLDEVKGKTENVDEYETQ